MNPTQARPSDIGIQSSSIPFYRRLFHSLSEGVSCVATVLSAKSFYSTFCIVGQFHMHYLCFYLALPFWDCLFYPSFIWAGFSGHWAQFLFNFALKICTTAQMFFPKKKKKRAGGALCVHFKKWSCCKATERIICKPAECICMVYSKIKLHYCLGLGFTRLTKLLTRWNRKHKGIKEMFLYWNINLKLLRRRRYENL